ncbi:hypothetical protein KVT40_002919 [Elsinoe batatas]|uniref:Asl1-like glycosyl hydrolase catalytic domain-containing protein n=1 Tax=Elsinoe batatas TaxID=2601811 RepID=A0A8K0PKP0_9PEZI|nr:hypothetical protein KVT40_002919 [Elsinoe batatas]
MAPVTQLGLVFLTTASVAFAERHAHVRGHRHVNRRQNRPYLTAPYGFTNGTVTVGPTGTGSTSDQTSTRTETLTSTLTQTLTAPGGQETGGAGDVPVGGDSAPTCGGTQYVTVTESVTVTASAGTPSTTPDAGEDEGDDEDESPAPSSSAALPSYAAPSSPAAAYASSESSAPVAEATPSSYVAPAPAPTTSSSTSELPAYTPPASYEAPAPAPSSSAVTTRDLPSASSSFSAAASPTGGYSGGNTGSTGLRTKRGCLYEYGMNDCAELTSGGKLSWITNWSDKPDDKTSGLTFVPQLWGHTKVGGDGKVHDYTVGWQENCKAALDAGSPAILGFNEPNIASQAALDAGAAASLWQEQIVKPFGSSGKILVSPGVTSEQNGPDDNKVYPGLDWLSSFRSAGAQWDATAVHMYANCNADAQDQLTYLKNMVNEAGKRFGPNVWVTEFGCELSTPAPADKQAAFISTAIEYLENEPSVKQYAAFKADTLAGNAAGNTYASMDSKTPS